MKILSSFDQLVNVSTQQKIEESCANIGGVESVYLEWANENTGDAPIYDVYKEMSEFYLFSIDTDTDTTFER